MIIYLVRCQINGRFYIGKTTRELRERWLEHCRDARNFHKSGDLYSDIRAFGTDAFDVIELGVAYCQRRLNQMERKFIRLHNATVNGYNQTEHSRGGKIRARSERALPTEEQRRKNAESVRAAWAKRKAVIA